MILRDYAHVRVSFLANSPIIEISSNWQNSHKLVDPIHVHCTLKTFKLVSIYHVSLLFTDSLDSSFITVGHKLFHLQGDTHRSFQWEKYGFRLHCPEGAVSKDTEVAVTAIAGGNFIVPKGTMLVSAVYAISVSKPLLQPLVIEMQHCVDLRYEGQTHCLKFVETPMKYPYQFIPIEGGSFSVGNRYGSLKATKFCLNAIVAEMSNGDRHSKDLETPSEGIGS